MVNINGMKLNPNSINKIAEFKNTNTNQNTEWIGFNEDITITPPIIVINDKKIYNCSIKLFQGQVPLPPLCYDLLYL